MSIPERHEAVKELRDKGLSQREIGDVLGADPMTVNRDLRSVENATLLDKAPNDINDVSGLSVASATAPVDTVAALAADDLFACQRKEIKPRCSV